MGNILKDLGLSALQISGYQNTGVARMLALAAIVISVWCWLIPWLATRIGHRLGKMTGALATVVILVLPALLWPASKDADRPASTIKRLPPLNRGTDTASPFCNALVDVAQLISYKDKYSVVLVCGLPDSTIDRLEDTRITVTKPFSIRLGDPVVMSAPYSESMLIEMKARFDQQLRGLSLKKGETVTFLFSKWSEIVLVPTGTNMSAIQRLSDIPRVGGKILSLEESW